MDRQCKAQLIWVLAGALISIHATPVIAQDNNRREDRREKFKARMEDRIERMHKELGLTPEQQQKLKSHRASKMKMRQTIRQKMRSKRQALKKELQKPNYDRQKVNALHSEIKQLMNKSHDERLNGIIYVREILTPAQYDAFIKKKERFKQNRGQRGDRGNRRGDAKDMFDSDF